MLLSAYLNFRLFFGITEPFIREITSEQNFATSFYSLFFFFFVFFFSLHFILFVFQFKGITIIAVDLRVDGLRPRREKNRREWEKKKQHIWWNLNPIRKGKIGTLWMDGAIDESHCDFILLNFLSDLCTYYFFFLLLPSLRHSAL